jgi:adenylosuccinate lyase
LQRLVDDGRLGLSLEQLEQLLAKPIEFTGVAREQVAQIAQKVSKLVSENPEGANYRPEPIL